MVLNKVSHLVDVRGSGGVALHALTSGLDKSEKLVMPQLLNSGKNLTYLLTPVTVRVM